MTNEEITHQLRELSGALAEMVRATWRDQTAEDRRRLFTIAVKVEEACSRDIAEAAAMKRSHAAWYAGG